MRTSEEIKKGLQCCMGEFACSECPYSNDGCGDDEEVKDALAYIQQLEVGINRYCGMAMRLERERDELFKITKQLECERDAAVEVLHGTCYLCIHVYPGISYLSGSECYECMYNGMNHDGIDKWQWHGVKNDG